jgi:hypothetical protein
MSALQFNLDVAELMVARPVWAVCTTDNFVRFAVIPRGDRNLFLDDSHINNILYVRN